MLDLQGDVKEHINILNKVENVRPINIKKAEELKNISALIIPGGESTSMGKLLKKYDFVKAIKDFHNTGKPIWGTCAGLILLSRKIEGNTNDCNNSFNLGLIDITVKRNAFGSQLNSFITESIIPAISPEPLELVFIRAPIITDWGPQVKILARVKGKIVAVEQKNVLATAFHPELTKSTIIHQYFINKIY